MATTERTTAAGWYVDPTTRHAYRYWDGTKWTETVSDEDVSVQASAVPEPAHAEDIVVGLRSLATACVTPAQMARTFGLPVAGLRDVLADRIGIKVSRGAARGATYTKRDLEVFDEAAKQRLFEVFLADTGLEQLARGAGKSQWWETAPGWVADAAFEFVGGSVEHVSTRRTPIRKRDFVLGVLGLSLGALLFLPAAWLSYYSWEAWREGKLVRPTGALVWGWTVGIGCVVAFAIGLVNALIEVLGAG